MKKLTYFILMLAVLGCTKDTLDVFDVNCLPNNLQNGVIAFYPFNDGSLHDQSSNNNDVVNQTMAKPSQDRNGNPNCAYAFDNSKANEEYLTTTNTEFLNGLDEFSISVWYQPIDTTRAGGEFESLVSRGNETRCPNKRGEWSVSLYDCRRAVFGHNNSVWANTVTSFSRGCEGEVAALTGKWHHVVGIKNGDNYKIYFDGHLDESDNGNANCTRPYLAEDIGDLFIGSSYTGKIDDILIYNRELSQAEIAELFELASCCE